MDNFSSNSKKTAATAVAISAASGRAVSSDDSASVEAVVLTGVAGSTATGIFVESEDAIASPPLRTPAKECAADAKFVKNVKTGAPREPGATDHPFLTHTATESEPGSLGSPPEPALCPLQPIGEIVDSQEKAPNKMPPGIGYEAQRSPDGRKCGDWFTDCGPAASDEWVVKEDV